MKVPLSWLKDYVSLPTSEAMLTDMLTLTGSLLDKRITVSKEVVLDLELRGNRPDLFGLIGIAREVSAIFSLPLKTPPTLSLPPIDASSPLLSVKSTKLVYRFTAIKLKVTTAPSPEWMAKRLKLFDIASVNNVVDITNYVMLETGYPLHAFDLHKLTGEKLIIRSAKPGELFSTIQQTTPIALTPDDLVISDTQSPQGTAVIGSSKSAVANSTTEIILEAAVYAPYTVRRTVRYHNLRTEAGLRHEKHQDPEQISLTLGRALYLLHKYAKAEVIGQTSEFYPQPKTPITISFPLSEIKRISSLDIKPHECSQILQRLGFKNRPLKTKLEVKIPTFRTDIEGVVDLVEEVARIKGYNHVRPQPLSGDLPLHRDSPSVIQEEKIRDSLTVLGFNEVITLPMIGIDQINLFSISGTFKQAVKLQNPPDPTRDRLRPSLVPNMVSYAKRALGFRNHRVSIFEIGKTYHQSKGAYFEDRSLGLLIAGKNLPPAWNTKPEPLEIDYLKGALERFFVLLGIRPNFTHRSSHPSLDPNLSGKIVSSGSIVGDFGLLEASIFKNTSLSTNVFICEINLDSLSKIPITNISTYSLPQPYTPIIRDFNLTLSNSGSFEHLESTLHRLSPLIQKVEAIDIFQNKLTARIAFYSKNKQLQSADIESLVKDIQSL